MAFLENGPARRRRVVSSGRFRRALGQEDPPQTASWFHCYGEIIKPLQFIPEMLTAIKLSDDSAVSVVGIEFDSGQNLPGALLLQGASQASTDLITGDIQDIGLCFRLCSDHPTHRQNVSRLRDLLKDITGKRPESVQYSTRSLAELIS